MPKAFITKLSPRDPNAEPSSPHELPNYFEPMDFARRAINHLAANAPAWISHDNIPTPEGSRLLTAYINLNCYLANAQLLKDLFMSAPESPETPPEPKNSDEKYLRFILKSIGFSKPFSLKNLSDLLPNVIHSPAFLEVLFPYIEAIAPSLSNKSGTVFYFKSAVTESPGRWQIQIISMEDDQTLNNYTLSYQP